MGGVAYSDEEGDGDEEERVGQERVNPEEQNNSNVVAPAVQQRRVSSQLIEWWAVVCRLREVPGVEGDALGGDSQVRRARNLLLG